MNQFNRSKTANLQGLSFTEAKHRLKRFGPNAIEEKQLLTLLKDAAGILLDPMGIMLLALAVIYWLMGEVRDSLILFIFYVPIVAVDVILELRSHKALASLKKTLQSRCHVIREGRTHSIPSHDLVPGDLLVLEEGQIVPADGNILESSNLSVNESSVTGESVPINKVSGDTAISGTEIISGNAVVEITGTGKHSQIGAIAKSIEGFRSSKSPLLKTVNRIVKIIFLVSVSIAALIFFLDLWNQRSLSQSLISALTLAMAAIPEEFPLVFTIYLSMAAYRLSKRGILVKSLPAVEGLARVEIICTDKTGTLTEGKFQLTDILTVNESPQIGPEILSALVFSCEPKATDAMESAIFERVRESHGDLPELLQNQWKLKFDYPFEAKNKYMSHVWQNNSTNEMILCAKGSLEGILKLCQPWEHQDRIIELARKQAAEGMRILALAAKSGLFNGNRQQDENNLRLVAILCFTDPVRASVIPAVQYCAKEKIEIKMLTGDHLLTAHSIADKIGLPHGHDQLYDGSVLENLSESERSHAYANGKIFARLKPDQKLELIRFLKSAGKIVAMTGDGINDAPALKLADVSISMGEKATDIARSTAQIILMKNDFSGIAASVQEGRNVLDSLRQGFGYLIAFHLPILFLALFQSFYQQQILHPIHIVLLELIVHPISAFVFENSPTHSKKASDLFSYPAILWSTLRGAAICIFSLILIFSRETSQSNEVILLLVLSNFGIILGEKGGYSFLFSKESKKKLLASFSLLLLLTTSLSFIPLLRELFSLPALSLKSFLLLMLASFIIAGISPYRMRNPLNRAENHR